MIFVNNQIDANCYRLDCKLCHIRRSIGASDVAKNGVSFVSAKSRVDEFFGRGGCTDGNLEESLRL